MTAHVNLPLGTPVTIAYYPPANLDPATYGNAAGAELHRSDLAGQGIETMQRAVRGVTENSEGETQRGFRASFNLKIGNLGERQQEHGNNALNLAGAGQNIFNTRNTLDQISQEYQQRVEMARAQAMMDPTGMSAAALPSIEQLHGMSAMGAAQIVGQTFAAAHEHFKAAIAAGLPMLGPSPVMPGAMNWGPAPGIPSNMWDYVMQPTATGSLGSNGSVIDSILGNSPSLLNMGFGFVQGLIDTVHGIASGITGDIAKLFGVDLDALQGLLPGGMQMPQGWGQLPFNPAMHGLNLFNPNDPAAGLSLLPGQGGMAGQFAPPSFLNAGFPGMPGGMDPASMMQNFGYGAMNPYQQAPGTGMAGMTPPGMYGNPAAYNPAMLSGHPAMGGMQVPQNMFPPQHWQDPNSSPYQPESGSHLSGSLSLGNILDGLLGGGSSDPAPAPAPEREVVEVSNPAPAPAPEPAPEPKEEPQPGGEPPKEEAAPAPAPTEINTQTTSEAAPERKFGISASLGINTPIGSLNGSFDAYTRLTAFEAPTQMAGMGGGGAGAGAATMAPPAAPPMAGVGGGAGALGGAPMGAAPVGGMPMGAAPVAAAAGAGAVAAGATPTTAPSTGGGGGSTLGSTSFGQNAGQPGSNVPSTASPLRPGTPLPPSAGGGDAGAGGRDLGRDAVATNLPDVGPDHDRAGADAFLVASLPDATSHGARILARLLASHDSIGVVTAGAVATMRDGSVVYSLSDALGMPPVDMDLPTGTPLLAAISGTQVEGLDAPGFVSEWMGADDPASVLALAAAVGFIDTPESIVTNYVPGGAVPEGVEFVHPDTLARITPAKVDEHALDHLPGAEASDMDAIMSAMREEWLAPEPGSYTHAELTEAMIARRWSEGSQSTTQALFATVWWMLAEIEKEPGGEAARRMAVQTLHVPTPRSATAG